MSLSNNLFPLLLWQQDVHTHRWIRSNIRILTWTRDSWIDGSVLSHRHYPERHYPPFSFKLLWCFRLAIILKLSLCQNFFYIISGFQNNPQKYILLFLSDLSNKYLTSSSIIWCICLKILCICINARNSRNSCGC